MKNSMAAVMLLFFLLSTKHAVRSFVCCPAVVELPLELKDPSNIHVVQGVGQRAESLQFPCGLWREEILVLQAINNLHVTRAICEPGSGWVNREWPPIISRINARSSTKCLPLLGPCIYFS